MVKARVRVVLGTASQERTVWLYAPPAAEVLVHDEDGRWKYQWDAENRLIAQEERGEEDHSRPAGAPARKRLSFAYDYLGRRIAKTVREWSTATSSFSTLVKDLRYVYDGWNKVAELDHTTTVSTGLGGSAVVRTYVWGPDIAGQRSPGAGMPGFQEAGGVGGLLGVNHQGTTYFPLMDGNGNIMGLHAGNGPQEGQLVARYDYDPFGNRITNTGPDVELCPFGFSTKYTDSETGFVYFGHRYYEPPTGRWPSRDPIGERGGINLYCMCGNNAVNWTDYLGLDWALNILGKATDSCSDSTQIRVHGAFTTSASSGGGSIFSSTAHNAPMTPISGTASAGEEYEELYLVLITASQRPWENTTDGAGKPNFDSMSNAYLKQVLKIKVDKNNGQITITEEPGNVWNVSSEGTANGTGGALSSILSTRSTHSSQLVGGGRKEFNYYGYGGWSSKNIVNNTGGSVPPGAFGGHLGNPNSGKQGLAPGTQVSGPGYFPNGTNGAVPEVIPTDPSKLADPNDPSKGYVPAWPNDPQRRRPSLFNSPTIILKVESFCRP